MAGSGGFLKNSTKHQRTKILPLRWIGNQCSLIAINSLIKAFKLQEDGNLGYRFKFHSKIWHYFNKPYTWWGTYYRMNLEK
jgi:predicted amidohydrolase